MSVVVPTFKSVSRADFNPGLRQGQRYRHHYGDYRLECRSTLLRQQLWHSHSSRLGQLSTQRADQVGAARFFNNPRVTPAELIYRCTQLDAPALAGKHLLAIIDSSNINVSLADNGRHELVAHLGCSDAKGTKPGYLFTPTILLDSELGTTLGVADVVIGYRPPAAATDAKQNRRLRGQRSKQLDYWDKEDSVWAHAVSNTMHQLQGVDTSVTFVADRGADIFELYEHLAQWPTANFVVRLKHNRQVTTPVDDQVHRIATLMASLVAVDERPIKVRALNHRSKTRGKERQRRRGRTGRLQLRYVKVNLQAPANSNGKVDSQRAIQLTVVDVVERLETVPIGEKPIHWCLLTTQEVVSVEQAWAVVDNYRKRWTIEQNFRLLKVDGLDLECSQLQQPEALQKLAIMQITNTLRAQRLVQLRDGEFELPIEEVFDEAERVVLDQLASYVPGKTALSANPHPRDRAAYGIWLVARFGGWTGYASQRPPGYKRIERGLARFDLLVAHYRATQPPSQDVCTP